MFLAGFLTTVKSFFNRKQCHCVVMAQFRIPNCFELVGVPDILEAYGTYCSRWLPTGSFSFTNLHNVTHLFSLSTVYFFVSSTFRAFLVNAVRLLGSFIICDRRGVAN